MDLGPGLAFYQRRVGHAWGAWMLLVLVLLVFGVGAALLPGARYVVAPLCALGIAAIVRAVFFRGGVTLAVQEHGFVYEGGGKRLEAPWTQVTDVRFSHVLVRSYGVLVSDNMGLGATLESGERLALLTREDEGHRVIEQFVARSQPAVAARIAGLEASGGAVDFGDLTLDAAGLHYRSFGRRTLSWENVAGYRVAQGYLMFDRDPAAPRLAFKLPAYRIGNLPILLHRLEEKLPRGDYARFPPDPSKSSILRTTAASHDPRYLTRRQRLGILVSPLALIPLGLLYALISLPWALELTHKRSAFRAASAEETRITVEHLAAMAKAAPTARLWDACAATTLGPVGDELEVKIGPLPEGTFGGEVRFNYDPFPRLGYLERSSENDFLTTIDGDFRPASGEVTLGDSLYELLLWAPWTWSSRLERMDSAQRKQPFLVLAHVRAVSLPEKRGREDPGAATLHVQLTARTGEVLCEGLVTKALEGVPPNHRYERDRLSYGLAAATMVDVCEKLGDGYCASLRRFVKDPDATPPPASSSSVKPATTKRPRR